MPLLGDLQVDAQKEHVKSSSFLSEFAPLLCDSLFLYAPCVHEKLDSQLCVMQPSYHNTKLQVFNDQRISLKQG